MKQNISIDDLNQLSPKGKKRLREWWKPKRADLFSEFETEYLCCLVTKTAIYNEQEYKFDKEVCLPLLSIGQMIEFLGKELGEFEIYFFINQDWVVSYDCNDSGEWEKEISNKELCDALWSAVKEILEAKV